MKGLLITTGTLTSIHRAGDLAYFSETRERSDYHFEPIIDCAQVDALIGNAWQVYQETLSGRVIRRAAEVIEIRQAASGRTLIRSGIVSYKYAVGLKDDLQQGKKLFIRKFGGVKQLNLAPPYRIQNPRGDIRPLTYAAKLRALELGWSELLSLSERMRICGKVIRWKLRQQPLRRQAVKSAQGLRAGQTVAAHNLVFCPAPAVLRDVHARGLPVDAILETAARRALETYERKSGVKLFAVCSTHLEDSQGFRPHLHVRLVAYDSSGKYVPLFDRKNGYSGGNRCIFEHEMVRQFEREIERER
jgi:hypothetical protein